MTSISGRIARQIEKLRRGGELSVGPFTVIRTMYWSKIISRLTWLERWLANSESESEALASSADTKARRSVVFFHNCYYNFYYLAAALRRRGWDALSVSIEDPDGENAKFYHGNDLCLFDADSKKFQKNLETFFEEVEGRFKFVQFYGRGHMSMFPSEFDRGERYDHFPFDILRLKRQGIKIGYSVCGCLDGVAQSSVADWSDGACNRCVWQKNPRICNDLGNLAWGHKFQMLCDLVASEGFPALDYQSGEKVYREPLTTALDPDFWHPNLPIPSQYRFARSPGELIVYHAVGNYQLRSKNGRNLKGTDAVVDAVDRLRSEGMNVRLEFVTGVPNAEVRFFQIQADVIVDQLNYGRYGATAREGMMLGRPTVCYINKKELVGERKLESIETCPLVSANEDSIYHVLRELLMDESKRQTIGIASREFGMKWHSADACAQRFEEIYDRIVDHLRPTE